MQFKVPQFLDIEDKIFGPFTFRQFVYLVGGGGMCFTLYKLLGLTWGALPIAFVASLALALTFYRPNSKPFVDMLEAGIKYFIQDKLYVWQKERRRREEQESARAPVQMSRDNKAGGDRLRDLAWSLDVLDLGRQPLEK